MITLTVKHDTVTIEDLFRVHDDRNRTLNHRHPILPGSPFAKLCELVIMLNRGPDMQSDQFLRELSCNLMAVLTSDTQYLRESPYERWARTLNSFGIRHTTLLCCEREFMSRIRGDDPLYMREAPIVGDWLTDTLQDMISNGHEREQRRNRELRVRYSPQAPVMPIVPENNLDVSAQESVTAMRRVLDHLMGLPADLLGRRGDQPVYVPDVAEYDPNPPPEVGAETSPNKDTLACVFCDKPGKIRAEGFAPECDECASYWEDEK